MQQSPWSALEFIPGLVALPSVWRRRFSTDYETFKTLCLQTSALVARSSPCPSAPACAHRLIANPDGSATGICRAEPAVCAQINFTPEEITPLELSWSKLGRAIAKAFQLNFKLVDLPVHMTRQVGAWSADAVPVILTIQTEPHNFLFAVGQLAARLRQKFILLTPTTRLVDVRSKEILANHGAELFALDATVTPTPQGTLLSVRSTGELFAKFTSQPSTPNPHPTTGPRFSLRKGLGVWHLAFDGNEAVLKHEKGIFYVAWLLQNPPEIPIHALDLIAKIPEMYRKQLGLAQIIDPATGKSMPLLSGARLQERSLSLDDAQSMRYLLREEKKLEAILEDPEASEPVKNEAFRDLEQILEFQRQHGRRSKDSAQRAVRTVRMAITRLHEHLLAAINTKGNPNSVLRSFAVHLENHLLIPSARYRGSAGALVRGPLAGCFTYEPPPGISWAG